MAAKKRSPRKAKPAHYVLVFMEGPGMIDRGTVAAIQRKLDVVIKTPRERTTIDIWLDSGGGDAHAAYKLGIDLRARASTLRAVVPDYAKSAATLLVLGMDEIYMGPSAELGPLDVQVAHPDKETETVSGLDIADALEFLNESALNLAIAGGAALVTYTQLPRAEVLGTTLKFMASFFRPVVAKLDPMIIHRAASQLRVAHHYAVRLMGARGAAKDRELTTKLATSIVQNLVANYPTHGSIIDRIEARQNLKLPILDAETHPHWPLIKAVHRQQRGSTFIQVWTEQDLEKLTSPTMNGAGPKVPKAGAPRPSPRAGAKNEKNKSQPKRAGNGAGSQARA
ncbi:MAG: hypothetical protein KF764_25415 [Labilithrix sp.]|nr:hypothetical protein [Labilithrix sp.]